MANRVVKELVSVDLPLPPSLNKAFASSKAGSKFTMKTASYKFWVRQVREQYGDGAGLPILPSSNCYGFWLDLSHSMSGDIDNRIKLASDILMKPKSASQYGLGIVLDDGLMSSIHVELQKGMPRDRCRVTVVAIKHWPDYVKLRMD